MDCVASSSRHPALMLILSAVFFFAFSHYPFRRTFVLLGFRNHPNLRLQLAFNGVEVDGE